MFMGPAIALFLSLMAARQPQLPQVLSVRTVGPYRVQTVKLPGSKARRMIVSRLDAKKMTECPSYFALVDHEFICSGTGQWCGGFFNVATGSGTGEDSDEACSAAIASACDGVVNAGCSYVYCREMTNEVGPLVGQQGDVCMYTVNGYCGSLACQ